MRLPQWRLQAAQDIAAEFHEPDLSQATDAWIASAAEYLLAYGDNFWGEDDRDLAEAFPVLHRATRIFLADDVGRLTLEAWLATGEPHGVVAEKSGLPPEVVEAYAAVFYDLPDRSARDARLAAIRDGAAREPDTLGAVGLAVRLFAATGGPLVVEPLLEVAPEAVRILDGTQCGPVSGGSDGRVLLTLLVEAIPPGGLELPVWGLLRERVAAYETLKAETELLESLLACGGDVVEASEVADAPPADGPQAPGPPGVDGCGGDETDVEVA